MSTVQNEINGLMADLHEIAMADPLSYFCLEALARALLEQMEAVWPVITDESKIGLASIALALQHRESGVVAAPSLASISLQ